MKGYSDRRFRRFNQGKVRSLAISALFCYLSMDRQTESFVCLGLIVILLQNTGRSQAECSKKFTDLSGQILDTLHKETRDTTSNSNNRGSSHVCRYRVCAPPDHYIILNITRLEGTPLAPAAGHACLPKAVVKSGGPLGRAADPLATLCQGERPLPLVVHSQGNELRIVFRSQSWQTSTFQASFTFHKRTGPSSCIACPLVQKLNESMNASFTLQPQNDSRNSHLEVPNGATEDSTSSGAWHMEYFVLVVLAPLTVVCLCCVIMFYLHRRSNRLTSHTSSLPTSSFSITSDNPPVPVTQSPLIPRDRFSSQHQQDRLRKQREMVCSHSESTEKFPTSVCLPDEDEPQHMRDNIRIHREVMSENGIRAPPNRTVYDSERQDLMIQCRSKTENLQRHSVRRTPSNVSQSKRGAGGGGVSRAVSGAGFKHGATTTTTTPPPMARTAASLQGLSAIDSETRSPLNLVDSDSEGPPPYASLVQTKNNIINVCDDSTVSTSSGNGGTLQSQPRPCTPPSSSCQPNSNGRFHASARGANRGSGVRLKNEGPDKV